MAVRRTAQGQGKGKFMPKNSAESKTIEQLLAEADELMQRMNTGAIKDLKEEHRLEFEKHAEKLNTIKSEVQGKIEKKESSKIGSGAEGMHEAILDIVKAMQGLTKYLS
jgi:hypothetical protein